MVSDFSSRDRVGKCVLVINLAYRKIGTSSQKADLIRILCPNGSI